MNGGTIPRFAREVFDCCTVGEQSINLRKWSAYPAIFSVNADIPVQRPSASSGLMHCSKQNYSITSSARASSVGGMVTPIALAVVMLTTSSTLVGNSTGRSAGFAPLTILSTK
jgi:hypothetical protein